MLLREATKTGHSADVRMLLFLRDESYPIAQMGPDFFILAAPFAHPPTDAELMVSIDGSERRWKVRLPAGIDPAQTKTPIARHI